MSHVLSPCRLVVLHVLHRWYLSTSHNARQIDTYSSFQEDKLEVQHEYYVGVQVIT